MFLFRLISFAFRIIGALVFTLMLQIQWKGKTLESYLFERANQDETVKIIKRVGKDAAYVVRHITSFGKYHKQNPRDLATEIRSSLEKEVEEIKKKITIPEEFKE